VNIHMESLILVGKFLVLQIYEEAFDQALMLPAEFAISYLLLLLGTDHILRLVRLAAWMIFL